MSELKKTYEEIQLEWKVCVNLEGTIRHAFVTFLSPFFVFANSKLYLQLGGRFTRSPEETTLGLIRKDDLRLRSSAMECTFGLKKLNGNVIPLGTRIMKVNDREIIYRFAELSDEIAQRSEDILCNDLTLTFILKIEILSSSDPNNLNEPKRKKLREEGILSRNFEGLYANKLSCDVVVRVKDKEFQAHKAVLIARSKVFAAMFHHETTEKHSGIITILDCDANTFHHFLEYLYCGRLEGLSFQQAFALYETAEKYDVLELKIFCREQLIQSFTVEKFSEVVLLAEKYNDASLMSSIEYFFHEKAGEIINTPDWDYLLQTSPSSTSRLFAKFKEMTEERINKSAERCKFLLATT